MENPNVSNLLLPSVSECNNMTLEGVAELYDNMRKETILKQFCDLQKIKYRESINQFYIVIDRKQYTAKTRRDLIDKLFEKYCGDAVTTLEQAYLEWMHWRASINTSSKTLKENKNEWKHYIQDSSLAKMQVAKIEIADFEAFLYDVTMDFAITSKRLSNILSVLNGILRRCVSRKIIEHNLLSDVDMKIFRKRCKPQNSNKDNYTLDERLRILDYLADKTDIYSLAIRFSFFVPLRISETCAIKYSDVRNGQLHIQRAQRTCQKMNDDLTFEARYLTNEERIKGNKASGFRTIPLTDTALSIIEQTHSLYPDTEYLFMRDGEQILANTFNEALMKICKELKIKYRSSHQIRFTVATLLFENGIPITQLSTLLGHADTAMTWHYIRKQEPDAQTADIMRSVLG